MENEFDTVYAEVPAVKIEIEDGLYIVTTLTKTYFLNHVSKNSRRSDTQ